MDDAARKATKIGSKHFANAMCSCVTRDGNKHCTLGEDIATALRELEAERDAGAHNYRGTAISCEEYEQMQRHKRDALATRLARVEEALRPFTSGGNWGKWKAWLVEGARHLGKVSEGLDAAQAITRWQCQVDEAVAVLTPDAIEKTDG